MSTEQQQALLKQHFALYGISLIESFIAWWAPSAKLHGRVTYEGLDNLRQALDSGQGVLLMSGHFTTLEIGLRLLGQQIPFDIMYRPHKNPLFENIMTHGRERCNGKALDRRDVRGILHSLKSGRAIWYGPDQDYGRKHSVFVPFMGVPAATVTATSRLARLGNATVVPYVVRRNDKHGYHVQVFPALENFPGDDMEADAIRVNRWFEEQIRQQPADYLWTHRRFKTRPGGEQRPY